MAEYNNKLFNELKGIKERLEDRHSSVQLVNTLDYMLLRGLKPIIANTTIMDELFASIVSWYSSVSRRKISRLSKAETLAHLASFITQNSTKEKCRIVKRMGLERNIQFYALVLFLEAAKKYTELEIQLVKTKGAVARQVILNRMYEIQRGVGATGSLSPAYYEVKTWFDIATDFRNQIIEKYTRHALNRANAYYRSNDNLTDRVDLSDLIQNFILGTNKALNKFDARKGTLTSYINHWLRDAQTPSEMNHEYGTVYSVPSSVRRNLATSKTESVNIYVSMHENKHVSTIACESDTPETLAESQSEIDRVRQLAKYADPYGFVRLKLGIEEVLSKEELSLLETHREGKENG